MKLSRLLAAAGAALLSIYIINVSPADIEAGRMKNVSVSGAAFTPAPLPSPAPTAEPLLMPVSEGLEIAPPASAAEEKEEILETTIQGGLSIKNETSIPIDIPELLRLGRSFELGAEGAQILIIHTHGSEAYTPAGLDRYEASDKNRTEDTQYNIVRIGDELADIFTEAGLNVIHDREIYDYPSYTGSYTRSAAAIEKHLAEQPEIRIVLDVHRDALDSNGVIYKTMAEEEGVCASQIMLLVGSDASGLEHPNWRGNLALALYLQETVNARHPTLMRPVALVKERYNQHLSPGSMIIEVGSSGNTLQEALAAIRLFARSAAPALLELTANAP